MEKTDKVEFEQFASSFQPQKETSQVVMIERKGKDISVKIDGTPIKNVVEYMTNFSPEGDTFLTLKIHLGDAPAFITLLEGKK